MYQGKNCCLYGTASLLPVVSCYTRATVRTDAMGHQLWEVSPLLPTVPPFTPSLSLSPPLCGSSLSGSLSLFSSFFSLFPLVSITPFSAARKFLPIYSPLPSPCHHFRRPLSCATPLAPLPRVTSLPRCAVRAEFPHPLLLPLLRADARGAQDGHLMQRPAERDQVRVLRPAGDEVKPMLPPPPLCACGRVFSFFLPRLSSPKQCQWCASLSCCVRITDRRCRMSGRVNFGLNYTTNNTDEDKHVQRRSTKPSGPAIEDPSVRRQRREVSTVGNSASVPRVTSERQLAASRPGSVAAAFHTRGR